MAKLCTISYYGPIETIGLAEKSLSDCNIEVYDFPLFKYMHDVFDKVDNYIDKLVSFVKDNGIEFILWWFINIPTDEFIEIKKQTNVKYLFFNWDEPYNWPQCDIINKMPYFDMVFVTCKETLSTYLNNGCKYAYCLYPGFSQERNFIIKEMNSELYAKYSCDISICCTNLYENNELYPNQYINRKKLISDIYNNQTEYGYSFYIYGPESLKELYPLSYRGFAKYDELNYIFNYSKINLCTHVLNNKKGYLNERVILIGGSGGLLLVDSVDGINEIFKLNDEIIILDKHYYIQQIKSILNDYDKYIDVRKAFNDTCIKKYTYNNWANFIYNKIIKL